MKIYVYKMSHDSGTAPCVENGLLTLAICKPDIRRLVKVGDFVLGIGGQYIGQGRVIYAAKVTGKMGPGEEYYREYPNREDAIYRIDKKGLPRHRGGTYDHAVPEKYWIEHDVGRKWEKAYAFLSTDYRYFGEAGERRFDYYSNALKWATVGWEKGQNPLTADKPVYPEICQFLQDLWSEPAVQNKPTHTKFQDLTYRLSQDDRDEPYLRGFRAKYRPMHKEFQTWKKNNPNL
jgi:hypothetical protein